MPNDKHSRGRSTAATLGFLVLFGGCATGDKGRPRDCKDIAPGSMPQPLGTFACQWQTSQAALAELDRYCIHENEWYLGGRELGPDGQQHLAQIAEHLKQTSHKAVIEPHFNADRNAPDAELNQARVDYVILKLVACGVEDAPNRVILAPSHAEGLYGPEAAAIGAQRLQGGNTSSGSGAGSSNGPFGGTGSTAPSGGFGGAGSTPGGF